MWCVYVIMIVHKDGLTLSHFLSWSGTSFEFVRVARLCLDISYNSSLQLFRAAHHKTKAAAWLLDRSGLVVAKGPPLRGAAAAAATMRIRPVIIAFAKGVVIIGFVSRASRAREQASDRNSAAVASHCNS